MPMGCYPQIYSLSQNSGPTTGGTTVVITGTCFNSTNPAAHVWFGSVECTSWTRDSNTQITATAPAHAAGTIDIRVQDSSGTYSDVVSADQFTYSASLPSVTEVSPSSGPGGGGTTVVITGTLFTGATDVKFGTVSAASFTVDSATQITAVSPAHAGGTIDITVTTSSGTSSTSSADHFTFTVPTVTAITPSSGPVAGGAPVLITGTHFLNATAVSIGGTAVLAFYVLNDTQISAFAPAYTAGAADVAVTTSDYGTGTGSSLYTYVANDTSTRIDVTVTDGIDDACAKATFRYDGIGVGLSDSDYGTKVVIQIPDASGTLHTVFVGQCQDSDGTFGLADDKIEMTAYDYVQFLTGQPLNDSDLSLLPASQQAASTNNGRALNYKSATSAFVIGQQVVGTSSKAVGRIVAIDTGTNLLTLYPAQNEFVDSEALYVGDTQYALADGHSVDVPYSTHFGTVYPEDWVESLLGPASGVGATGVNAFRIVPTTHDSDSIWDTDPVTSVTIASIPKTFTSEQNKLTALKDLSLYLRRLAVVKPALVSTVWVAAMYWCRISQIDDSNYGLGLPSAATVTYPCTDMIGNSITLVQTGSDQVERIHLSATSLVNSYPLDAILPATAPAGPYRECREVVTNVGTQKDLDDLCLDYYNAKTSRAKVWTCTFIQRPDLQKYQLLTLSGYGPKVPDGTYRIIRVTHTYGPGINKTQVQFILNSAFSSKIRLGWTYQDTITQIETIIASLKKTEQQNTKGKVVATNSTDGTVTVQKKDDGTMVICEPES